MDVGGLLDVVLSQGVVGLLVLGLAWLARELAAARADLKEERQYNRSLQQQNTQWAEKFGELSTQTTITLDRILDRLGSA